MEFTQRKSSQKGDLQKNCKSLDNSKTVYRWQLRPRRKMILNLLKKKLGEVQSTHNIHMELNITEEEYCNALSMLFDCNSPIYIKHEPNSCFVDNIFIEGLQTWKANIDIQPVVNN